jgi:hypothetical protein
VPSDSLSTVPWQVIESAKELDPEFLKLSKNNSISELSGAFDNLPEDMDEEELAKMLEEEDFAGREGDHQGHAGRHQRAAEADQGGHEGQETGPQDQD